MGASRNHRGFDSSLFGDSAGIKWKSQCELSSFMVCLQGIHPWPQWQRWWQEETRQELIISTVPQEKYQQICQWHCDTTDSSAKRMKNMWQDLIMQCSGLKIWGVKRIMSTWVSDHSEATGQPRHEKWPYQKTYDFLSGKQIYQQMFSATITWHNRNYHWYMLTCQTVCSIDSDWNISLLIDSHVMLRTFII